MSSQPIFRFAPSPNGALHLGHAFSALQTQKWAREAGGKFLLRIEDTDTNRCKPELTVAVLDDLDWLGITSDQDILAQSTRFPAYQDAATILRRMGFLYPCFCSRAQIADTAIHKDPDGAHIYPGTCKHLSNAAIKKRLETGDPVQYRLHMEKAVEKAGMLTFSQSQPSPVDRPQIKYARPMRWGDAVIVRKDTPTSYHLAVVVDDAMQQITHVTRGRDMEAATDLHILLQLLLGLPQPIYTFHRLILDDAGQKLSKSISSQTLKHLRAQGWTAQDVRRAVGFEPR